MMILTENPFEPMKKENSYGAQKKSPTTWTFGILKMLEFAEKCISFKLSFIHAKLNTLEKKYTFQEFLHYMVSFIFVL